MKDKVARTAIKLLIARINYLHRILKENNIDAKAPWQGDPWLIDIIEPEELRDLFSESYQV